ncbi:hypothetical protein [Thermovibrio sp.]
MLIKSLTRFRDESIGGVRVGPLEGETPEDTVFYFQAFINGELFSGIRAFHRLASCITIWRVDLDGLKEELREGWKKVVSFVQGRETEVEAYYPRKLTLAYGEADFSPFNYCTVRTAYGSFSFVEAEVHDLVSFNLPLRDLKGMDFTVASRLFTPPLHSYLSLKTLNLIR